MYTTFVLPSGALVYVESSKEPPALSGTVEASAAEAQMREAWTAGAKLVAEVGAGLIDALRSTFEGVEEVTVEFGANISGKMGVILVEGTAAANLKIVVKWRSPKTG